MYSCTAYPAPNGRGYTLDFNLPDGITLREFRAHHSLTCPEYSVEKRRTIGGAWWLDAIAVVLGAASLIF